MTRVAISRRGRGLMATAHLLLDDPVETESTGSVLVDLDGATVGLTDADALRLSRALAGMLAVPAAPVPDAPELFAEG